MAILYLVWQEPKRKLAAVYSSAVMVVHATSARDAIRQAHALRPDDIGLTGSKEFKAPQAAIATPGLCVVL